MRLHDGQIGDWWHAFASSHIIFTSAGFPPWMQRLADVVGDPGVARDPAHLALASARDAAELFARWSRLERYLRSRHRCQLLSMDPQEARLRHVTLRGGEPPLAAEDLVVLGLWAALLQAIGLEDVRAWAGGVPVLRVGWAPRNLQRALSRAGLGYVALLAELRCRSGAWWLLHTRASIAELGFVCGYADQSHFTRELHRRVGLTPAGYREAFATLGNG